MCVKDRKEENYSDHQFSTVLEHVTSFDKILPSPTKFQIAKLNYTERDRTEYPKNRNREYLFDKFTGRLEEKKIPISVLGSILQIEKNFKGRPIEL